MFRAVLPTAMLVLLCGCGPIISTTAIVHARSNQQAALDVRAPELAVYEYTLASHLLDKAWEQQGYSQYQSCRELADEAARHFVMAERQARSSGDITSTEEQLERSEPDVDSKSR